MRRHQGENYASGGTVLTEPKPVVLGITLGVLMTVGALAVLPMLLDRAVQAKPRRIGNFRTQWTMKKSIEEI